MKHDDYKFDAMWERIEEVFAKNSEVKRLAKEMHDLERGVEIKTSQIANTAAGMVLRALRHDIEKLGNFNIEIVPFTDKRGYPGVNDPQFNKLYLTPIVGGKENYEWKKWIAVPNTNKHGRKLFQWERVGKEEEIDLSWVKVNFQDVNVAIDKLNNKLSKTTKQLANALINKAVKPIEELKKFVLSDEYLAYLINSFPRAGLNQDGLMTGGQFALLTALSIWASNDYKQIGGGALGADYVNEIFEKETILQNHATNKNK